MKNKEKTPLQTGAYLSYGLFECEALTQLFTKSFSLVKAL